MHSAQRRVNNSSWSSIKLRLPYSATPTQLGTLCNSTARGRARISSPPFCPRVLEFAHRHVGRSWGLEAKVRSWQPGAISFVAFKVTGGSATRNSVVSLTGLAVSVDLNCFSRFGLGSTQIVRMTRIELSIAKSHVGVLMDGHLES